MKLDDIEKLPAEFDFFSKTNLSGIVYHAKETKTSYIISWKASDDNGNKYELSDSCSKIEFWKKLKVDDYMPIGVKENPTKDAVNFIKKQIETLEDGVCYDPEYLMIRKMWELTSQYMLLDGDLSSAGEASDLRFEIEELAIDICRDGTDLTSEEFSKFLDSHNPKLQKRMKKEYGKREQVRQFVFNRRHRDLENEGNPEESVDIYCDICAILFDRNGNISQYDNTALQTKLQKVKVGDAVFCFDKNCDFAYEERKVRIERVKKDNAYKSDVNPEGIVLVGRDITIDEDGKSIFMVTDDNFIRIAEFVDEKNLDYVLTSYGKENVEIFIDECAAKRKEILVAGIDTADETNLPSEEDILSDLNHGVGIDEDGDYYNGWGVTDHYDSDKPISLHYGIDFVCKLGTKIIRKSTGETGVIIGIYDPQVELGKKLNPEDHPIGFMVRMKGKDCYDASLFIKEFEPVLE